MKTLHRFFALSAALVLLSGCAETLNPEKGGVSSSGSLRVTLSFVPAGAADAADPSAAARTLLPDVDLSSASFATIQVFNPSDESGVPVVEVTQADITVEQQVNIDLPGLGPWNIKATLYGPDGTTVVASGTKFSFLAGPYNYCGIPVEPPSTPTGTGTLSYVIYFSNMPVPLADVDTSLAPWTVDNTGTPIDPSLYRTDGEGQITINATGLPSGSYRLQASFTHNGRIFNVGTIDPVIRICDGATTGGSTDFDYYGVVFEPTMTFEINAYNPSAMANHRAFVLVWTGAQYWKKTSDGALNLYQTPYVSAPIGMGIVNLDEVTGTGSVTILDKTGAPLQFTRGEEYVYRVVVDSQNRYSGYINFATIPHPEAIVGDIGDCVDEAFFVKQNIGSKTVDPSYSAQSAAAYFVSAAGTGPGKTYETPCSWSYLGTQNLNNARIYLTTDIDVSTGLTVPDNGSIFLWSIGEPKTLRLTAVMSGSVFTVQNGGTLQLNGIGIDGTNATAVNSSALNVWQGGNLIMDAGSFVQNMSVNEGNGAALSVYGGSATIQNTRFSNNTVTAGHGGAVAVAGDVSVGYLYSYSGVSFTNNTASNGNGGALFIDNAGSVAFSFDRSLSETCLVMTGNQALGATGTGGGIYADAGSHLYAPSPWLYAVPDTGYASLCSGNTAQAGSNEYHIHMDAIYTDTSY